MSALEQGNIIRLKRPGKFHGVEVKVTGAQLSTGHYPVRTKSGGSFLATPQELGARERAPFRAKRPEHNNTVSYDVRPEYVPRGYVRDGHLVDEQHAAVLDEVRS